MPLDEGLYKGREKGDVFCPLHRRKALVGKLALGDPFLNHSI